MVNSEFSVLPNPEQSVRKISSGGEHGCVICTIRFNATLLCITPLDLFGMPLG